MFAWLALICAFLGVTGCSSSDAQKPTDSPKESTPKPMGTATPIASSEPNAVARIGGETITREQLTAKLVDDHGAETLRDMMLHIAVRLDAEKRKIAVSEEELADELRVMSAGYESEEAYYDSMQKQLGLSRADIREDTADRLLLEKLAVQGIEVSDNEIDRYRQEHADELGPRKQLHLAKIVVDDRKTAESVMEQLEAGVDFGALAKRYSIDEMTADSNGDAGWVDANDPFESADVLEAAANLKVGQATGPIGTDAGFVVIRLDGVQETRAEDPATERERIRRTLALEKAPPLPQVEQSLLDRYGARVLDKDLQSSNP